ncbi:MAG TPA: response regulator [Burkholderiaceae bacterium]|nr:response regulator [Burkholderiaceae bacterium]
MEAPAPTALIVDDKASERIAARRMLQRLGWKSVPVTSGEKAIEQLRQRRFDLVLLDLEMPGLGGEETCRRIRAQLAMADVAIVACIAHGVPGEREKLRESGFDSVLVKPVAFEDLRRLCVELGHAGR